MFKKSRGKLELEIEVDEWWGVVQHTAFCKKKRVKKKRFHIGGRGEKLQGNFGNHYHLFIVRGVAPPLVTNGKLGIIPSKWQRIVEKNKQRNSSY